MRESGKIIKNQVKDFYNEEGWRPADGEFYADTFHFEDLRRVTDTYRSKCHLRVKRHLKHEGKFLLDVGSGALPYPEYHSYSEGYQYHLCGDLSFQALLEAKKNLGSKGAYVQCDITNLPYKSNSLDGFVSLHTIYHVPAEEQLHAFQELYRVLDHDSCGVIVYRWGKYSPMMLLLTPQVYLKKAINRLKITISKNDTKQIQPKLYFYTHNYRWIIRNLSPTMSLKLFVWRSVSVPFLRSYIHERFWGKKILSLIYAMEEKFPFLMGKIGEYPMFVIGK